MSLWVIRLEWLKILIVGGGELLLRVQFVDLCWWFILIGRPLRIRPRVFTTEIIDYCMVCSDQDRSNVFSADSRDLLNLLFPDSAVEGSKVFYLLFAVHFSRFAQNLAVWTPVGRYVSEQFMFLVSNCTLVATPDLIWPYVLWCHSRFQGHGYRSPSPFSGPWWPWDLSLSLLQACHKKSNQSGQFSAS